MAERTPYQQQFYDEDGNPRLPGDAYDTLVEPTHEQLAGENYRGETALDAGESYAGRAEADKFSVEAQRRALAQMRGQMEEGVTAQERSRAESANRDIGQSLRGQTQGNLQDLQARGAGGSGAEVAALMGGAQAGANAMVQQESALKSQAQQRALQAMQQTGQMGAQMRNQSFGESYARGGAVDYFNQRATERAQGVVTRNNQRTNQRIDNVAGAYGKLAEMREQRLSGRVGVLNKQAEAADQKRQDADERRDKYVATGASIAKGTL